MSIPQNPPGPNDPEMQFELHSTQSVAVVLTSDFDLTAQAGLTRGFARELYVGTGGTVIAQLRDDAAPQTYTNVPSGAYMHGIWVLVKSTANGTTASGIIARA